MMLPPCKCSLARDRVWRSHCNTCLLAFPRAIREREAVCVLSTDVTCWQRHHQHRCCDCHGHDRQDRPRNQNHQRSDALIIAYKGVRAGLSDSRPGPAADRVRLL